MGYRNGPWQAWPCVTLTPGQLYMASRYALTPFMLPAMQKPTPESNETHPDTIDLQTPPISTEHDVMYDVITPWPDLTWPRHFQGRCKKNWRQVMLNFNQIGQRVLPLSLKTLRRAASPLCRRGLIFCYFTWEVKDTTNQAANAHMKANKYNGVLSNCIELHGLKGETCVHILEL